MLFKGHGGTRSGMAVLPGCSSCGFVSGRDRLLMFFIKSAMPSCVYGSWLRHMTSWVDSGKSNLVTRPRGNIKLIPWHEQRRYLEVLLETGPGVGE